MVIPVFFVAKEQLPTPAALNELACASPDPTDGIFTRFDLGLISQSKAKQDRSLVSSTRPCPKTRDVRIARIQRRRSRVTSRLTQPLDRTPGLLRYLCEFHTKGTSHDRHYSDEPPLNWTSHSHGIQLEGPALRKLAYFRSLSPVDETEIPGPAAPVWRNQLNRPYDQLECWPFERMRFA